MTPWAVEKKDETNHRKWAIEALSKEKKETLFETRRFQSMAIHVFKVLTNDGALIEVGRHCQFSSFKDAAQKVCNSCAVVSQLYLAQVS